MARPKTYIIKLSDDERAELQKTIHNKKTSKTILKRCQILLELDEVHGTGLTHAQIAHSYSVCPATITNIVQSYVKNGITNIVRYNINPNSSAARRKLDGGTYHSDGLWSCAGRAFTLDAPAFRRKSPCRTQCPDRKGCHTPCAKKNELRPHKNAYWCIPPKENAEFIACMEGYPGHL